MKFNYKKRLNIIVYFLFVMSFSVFSCNTNDTTTNTATIVKIIDGDTYKVSYNGKTESIRLIGIDTPESRANSKAKKDAKKTGVNVKAITALGKQATKYVKSLLEPGDLIKVELDVQERDRYGRILGYVYLEDGTFLNDKIIREGFAQVMTVPPNVKYQDKFLLAQQEARDNNRGLWSNY